MKLDDFCDDLENKIVDFKDWYQHQRRRDPQDFPEEMPIQDWMEQFDIYFGL